MSRLSFNNGQLAFNKEDGNLYTNKKWDINFKDTDSDLYHTSHAYDKDPLSGYHCSNGFYYEFMKGLSTLNKKENLKTIDKKLPILIIAGDSDPVGKNSKGPTKLNEIYHKYGLNSSLIIYKNMRHGDSPSHYRC